MKTVSQYQEEIKALTQELGAINARAMNENRDLNDTELEMKGRLMDKIEQHQAKIADLKREQGLKEILEKPDAVLTRSSPKEVHGNKDRFITFGEQMTAVMRAGIPGGHVDPRLNSIRAAASGLSETVPSEGGLA